MKIICIGRNYSEHIKELNNEKPENIVFFFKPDTALTKDNEDFYLPDFSNDVSYECELVVKIDKVGKSIPISFAHNYYSEVALGLDITLRDLQQYAKEKGLPWALAKGFDYSAPISSFYPLQSLGKQVGDLNFELRKNGNTVQKTNTSQMIHSVEEIIAYVSQFVTLKTGDLIFTGTPKGVGKMEKEDVFTAFLEDKQVMDIKVK